MRASPHPPFSDAWMTCRPSSTFCTCMRNKFRGKWRRRQRGLFSSDCQESAISVRHPAPSYRTPSHKCSWVRISLVVLLGRALGLRGSALLLCHRPQLHREACQMGHRCWLRRTPSPTNCSWSMSPWAPPSWALASWGAGARRRCRTREEEVVVVRLAPRVALAPTWDSVCCGICGALFWAAHLLSFQGLQAHQSASNRSCARSCFRASSRHPNLTNPYLCRHQASRCWKAIVQARSRVQIEATVSGLTCRSSLSSLTFLLDFSFKFI